MGKKSVKENKNAYQNSREEAGFTRQQASELMEFISADRIEKIENERTEPHPEEILAMSKCYKDSILFRFLSVGSRSYGHSINRISFSMHRRFFCSSSSCLCLSASSPPKKSTG